MFCLFSGPMTCHLLRRLSLTTLLKLDSLQLFSSLLFSILQTENCNRDYQGMITQRRWSQTVFETIDSTFAETRSMRKSYTERKQEEECFRQREQSIHSSETAEILVYLGNSRKTSVAGTWWGWQRCLRDKVGG